MIHNVLIIDSQDGHVITRVRFWKIDFLDNYIQEFLAGHRDLTNTEGLASDTPIYVDRHKVFHSPINEEMLLLFVTDGRDEDRVIRYKVREGASRIATALRGNSISYIRDNLDDILGELIFTHFKVSFVGSGGVGKSTLLRLLFGKEPAPGGYVPTINVAVDSSETIQFGTFMVTIWDFAGQAVFQDLWGFYFQGTDVIFLVTDSSFRNVMQTKTLLRNIRKEAPAVPLFIIANKQDLPESMKAEKIQRLLGSSTFPMVATDKARRDEFIRLMLEVAAKTVGVQLPDLPLSEMITVHKRSEPVALPDAKDMKTAKSAPKTQQLEDVPYDYGQDSSFVQSGEQADSSATEASTVEPSTGAAKDKTTTVVKASTVAQPCRILNLLLLIQKEGMFETIYHLGYGEEAGDTSSAAGLISALDSFGGVDSDEASEERTDALETIEHEGNLVMVEKSRHFVMALTVTNNSDEEAKRRTMTGLLLEIEHMYENVWEQWDGSTDQFEPSVFLVLTKFPLRSVSLDYLVKPREAGKTLQFSNRDVGRAIVEVRSAIEAGMTIGGLVRNLGLPRDTVLGALQIMAKLGWVDFKVEIGPASVPRKLGEVDEETRKAYGDVVVRFVDLCDGTATLEEVVRKVNVSLAAMKFVATKLVLDGVLEIVA